MRVAPLFLEEAARSCRFTARGLIVGSSRIFRANDRAESVQKREADEEGKYAG